jgi:hypothetical protein
MQEIKFWIGEVQFSFNPVNAKSVLRCENKVAKTFPTKTFYFTKHPHDARPNRFWARLRGPGQSGPGYTGCWQIPSELLDSYLRQHRTAA